MKEQGLIKEIIVMGCLSQRYREPLEKQIKAVDAFFGVDQFAEILDFVTDEFHEDVNAKRVLMTPKHFIYLKIAEGCNHKCSFCAIPMIKGPYRSVPQKEIIKEAKYFVSKGAKEINLIGQDTTYYGVDIDGKRQIATLMNRLAKETNVDWIRLHYTFPAGFPLDLLDVMASNDNICKYIDIPLQHISDNILQAMFRGYNPR
jgi:ribosomal protein S12 methylthiotransferase